MNTHETYTYMHTYIQKDVQIYRKKQTYVRMHTFSINYIHTYIHVHTDRA